MVYSDVDGDNIMTQEQKTAGRPLILLGVAMIPLFLLFAVGIFLDPRIVTGAPVWLKPAKFAISIAIYCLTLAWIFSYVSPVTKRLTQLAWVIAATLGIEIVIIGAQAARGTTSHFNNRTPLDGALFGIMGTAIFVLLLASIAVTVILFRQRFADSAWGWALRLGMAITMVGSASGGLMLRQPSMQTGDFKPAGAHTVGAADGGPGLFGTGWSTEHGDLRAPHFMGLHGMQALPLFAWVLGRRRRLRSQTVIVLGASYLVLFGILTVQALHGQSITAPDTATMTGLGIWLVATLGGLAVTWKE